MGFAHLAARCGDGKHDRHRHTACRHRFLHNEVPRLPLVCQAEGEAFAVVNHAAAADGHDKINLFFFAERDAFAHIADFRVRLNPAEFNAVNPGGPYASCHLIQKAGFLCAAAAVNHDDFFRVILFFYCTANIFVRIFSEKYFCRCVIHKIIHAIISL